LTCSIKGDVKRKNSPNLAVQGNFLPGELRVKVTETVANDDLCQLRDPEKLTA